ncbi:C40 family peptidase [Gordonia sihwensis]|uniref:C40 family peptidase n=1 Tax=Gordonia sihwensis TaxID=173559 RepID=UPI003D98AA37
MPDPRFNGAVDDNDEKSKRNNKRLRNVADTTQRMVDDSRNLNRSGTANLSGTTTPTTVNRTTSAPTSLMSLLTGGNSGQPSLASTIQQLATPIGQFANAMLPAMMQTAATAPATFNQSYSSAPNDQIVLTPQQQQRLAEALAAAQEGGPESTTVDGKDLSKGVHGEREQKVVQLAKAVVDAKIPYSWGGGSLTGPTLGISGPGLGANDNNVNGMDCSGFSRYVTYQSSGVEIPRTSGAQWAASDPVSKDQARPGDLVFPPGTQGSGHVQVYIGNGQIAEQYQSGTTARITPLDPSYEIRRPRGIAA